MFILNGAYVAFHAGLSWDEPGRQFIREKMSGMMVPTKRETPDSYIWGVGKIRRFVTNATDSGLPPEQRRWFFGPYGWIVTNFVPLIETVPCKGQLGLWKFNSRPREFEQLRASYERSVEAERKKLYGVHRVSA